MIFLQVIAWFAAIFGYILLCYKAAEVVDEAIGFSSSVFTVLMLLIALPLAVAAQFNLL